MVDPALGVRLVYVLGIMNIFGLALVFFSCRCLMGSGLFQMLWQRSWYKRFYSWHCYFWWLFFMSVFAHSVLALVVFGNPF